jgi:transketolase
MEKIATREAYGNALAAIGMENEKVVVLDADLSKSTKTSVFAKACPARFFDMGVAESNMAATAAGFAIGGDTVFMSSFAIFAVGRCYEIIRNSICYPKLNVKIAATHAGITVGEDGGSHQSIEDIALMRVLPNMQVFVPADGVETAKMVAYMASHEGPMYLRLGRSGQPVLLDEGFDFKPGRFTIMKEGKDVVIFACGLMVSKALEAAEILQKDGIDAAVVNASSLKPFDNETAIAYAEKCGAVVTAEEHSVIGGLSSAVAECLGMYRPSPMESVGVEDQFGQSGKPNELLEAYGLTAENIAVKAKAAIKRK